MNKQTRSLRRKSRRLTASAFIYSWIGPPRPLTEVIDVCGFVGMDGEDHAIFMRDLRTKKIRGAPPQRATRHKLDTRKYKDRAGRQILVLSEQAALFERSSGNAADWTCIYLSVRSTLRSLSRDARTSHRCVSVLRPPDDDLRLWDKHLLQCATANYAVSYFPSTPI